jgi:hypothetical protein
MADIAKEWPTPIFPAKKSNKKLQIYEHSFCATAKCKFSLPRFLHQ